MMAHGVYHGPDIKLLGKRAILRDPSIEGGVEAKFDFSGNVMNERNNGGPLNYLCFGWHLFQRSHFTLYPQDTGGH